ncbi:RNA polymerase sigma factor [Streptomyces sp. MZ04]|uniref:RNA polymerase sigma factor n=1 Tax=Streptomyces sp. MZ04 TaxID=2559236 RepID=UPI00107E950C|nr:RNA polymerase sigma factor [Streptomyces sp. MZ04]TGA87269.1 RNA polymerase sigma factor [Streptomyces sp. MZ04]
MGQGGERRRRAAGSDEALTRALESAKGGDEAAFAVVYRCVHPGLLGYVRGLVREDAEDVASEAWLQIVRDLGRFRGSGADFRRWTATVARHRAIDHVRRQRSRPRASVLEWDAFALPAVDDTAGEVLESMTTARVLGLVAELPPDQGEAVLLRVVVGLDGPAAAQVLGKRPAAVRAAAYRGLRRLARQLAYEAVPARSSRRCPGGAGYAMRRERRAA